MSFTPIYIDAYDCLTPAGHGVGTMLEKLFSGQTALANQSPFAHGSLPLSLKEQIHSLRLEKTLRDQDETTLMGLQLARALSGALESKDRRNTGLIIGSSRGPTQSLEKSFEDFNEGKRLKGATSPTTTASGISSVIARDLSIEGPSLFLSAACSTGLYSVIQGIGSLKAGLCDAMIVGGVEAANTPFTFAMLDAARVLNSNVGEVYPCRPGAEDRRGMVLSEGAALLLLSANQTLQSRSSIIGWGTATEAGTLTGVSENGEALIRAIEHALRTAGIDREKIDLIVGHGAGTLKGDNAELSAYRTVFGTEAVPALVWHKWCGGHMLGASATLSVMLGLEHLATGRLPPHPYFPNAHPMHASKLLNKPQIALITSMGFGGSACAILVKNLS